MPHVDPGLWDCLGVVVGGRGQEGFFLFLALSTQVFLGFIHTAGGFGHFPAMLEFLAQV